MQNSKLKLFACYGLAALFLPASVFAKQYSGPSYYDSFLGFTLGGSVGNTGDTNPTITRGTIVDEYPVTSNSSKSALVGINAGYEFLYPLKNFSFSIGVGAYTATAFKFKGNLVESIGGGAPTSLYNYSYNVTASRAMVEMQANWLFNCLAPFINGGIGASWNKAKGYKEIDNNNMYSPLAPFANKTQMSLAYQIGAGISYLFNTRDNDTLIPQERFTLGYNFVSYGTVKFGTRDASYPYSLDTGTMHANELYLKYIHYF